MAASKINGQSRLRIRVQVSRPTSYVLADGEDSSISGLVVEYIVAIDVTRVRFPADALFRYPFYAPNSDLGLRRAPLCTTPNGGL